MIIMIYCWSYGHFYDHICRQGFRVLSPAFFYIQAACGDFRNNFQKQWRGEYRCTETSLLLSIAYRDGEIRSHQSVDILSQWSGNKSSLQSVANKHDTLAQCWANAGPSSTTLGQH